MATPRLRRLLTAASLPLILVAAMTALPGGANALSEDVVISGVYGGGGQTNSPLKYDYIELANLTDAPVNVSGWSVQYASAAGGVFQMTRLTGSIPARGRYLVRQAGGLAGALDLPEPDAVGTIPMSATSGVVLLATVQFPMTGCRPNCATEPQVKDLVGYGTTDNAETAPAPMTSLVTAIARTGEMIDTDDNSADFVAGVPKATNSAGDTVVGESEPGAGDPQPGSDRIHDIQGTGRISPKVGQSVTNVPGIVTAVRTTGSHRGFWMQDPAPDADPRTSEAIFFFTGPTSPTVVPGDSVLVTGRVTEYRPVTGAQAHTTIGSPNNAIKLSSGNPLPAPVPVAPPDAFTRTGALEAQPLEPDSYALDWWEAHEGMRVTLAQDARLVSPVDTGSSEFWVTVKPGQNPSPRGGTVYKSYDGQNSGRVKIAALNGGAPAADVGAVLAAGTTGPVDQQFGDYSVQATELGEITQSGIKRQKVLPPAKKNDLSIATYNVENLAATSPDAEFTRLARGIVANLGSPDIIALEEVQDNNGTVDDGVVAADQTLAKLIAAIRAAGGPAYEWRSIDPVDDADGGAPGGNARQAFLFNPARTTFVDRPGGSATKGATVVKSNGNKVSLSASPGRINPTSAAWTDSRKPLVAEFTYDGSGQLFVIANHFVSRSGDYPLTSAIQPPPRPSEGQRLQQAAEIREFVQDLADKSAKKGNGVNHTGVVVLGGFNDHRFSPVLQTLTDNGALLRPLIETLPADQRYGHIADGNSQALDHILISPHIGGYAYGIVHINAEFSDRAGGHDPQILRIISGGCHNGTPPARCLPGSPVVDE